MIYGQMRELSHEMKFSVYFFAIEELIDVRISDFLSFLSQNFSKK